ncbi:MAG TPA: serine/threonine-protein kinase [Candidatus Limnocylindrales bacterium]|nr:serine/threonine-protein kinase [Candidatus Limnocylindrales bacterium]
MAWTVPGYLEIKDLGRGASGRVVLAEHVASGTKVAIKYLADHLIGDPDFAEAFRVEARILSEVEDPQIARLYEYVESTQGAAIVMELVDGVALRAILREHGPTEPQSALVVLKGSLLGLAAAHGHGIVHRDYKPENVLVNQEGQSKLADFGIAARTGLKGAHAGTPSYMAPEQWAGAPASPSTDIYAATATFFECLTGHPPYRSPGDVLGLRSKHENEPIPVDEVPEAVRGLVRRGLAKRPEQRPRDAGTYLVELEAVAGAGYGPEWEDEGRGALARRAALLLLLFPLAGAAAGGTGLAQTVLGWSKKSMNMVLAGGLALALAVAGFFWYQSSGDDGNPAAAVQNETAATASPSPSPEVSPSPSADAIVLPPTASPTGPLSPSPTRTSPRPRPPSPTPPPPPLVVTSWFAPVAGKPDFCWTLSTNQICFANAVRSRDQRLYALVHMGVNTSNGNAFNVALTFTEINSAGALGQSVSYTYTFPAEDTSRDKTEMFDLTTIADKCTSDAKAQIRLIINPAPDGPNAGPVYIADNICPPPG